MWHIKRPAHSSLTPNKIEWGPATFSEINSLKGYLCWSEGAKLQKKIDVHNKGLVGYYRLVGDEKIFIKIVPDDNIKKLLDAEEISSWLCNLGLSVLPTKRNFPKNIVGSNVWLFAYEYLDYEFSTCSKEQIYAIGRELGVMHRLLKSYPYKKSVKERGIQKDQQLLEKLKKIRREKTGLNLPQNAIELIHETTDFDYKVLTLSAQMIHGDMNFGNILFNKLTNKPVIIDFEDATASWLSPLYDLAFVLQRFVLLDRTKNRFNLASALIQGYCSENKLPKLESPNALFIMIKMISIRSLLILANARSEDQLLYLDEAEKFINLYKQTQDDQMLISDISSLIN